MGKYKKVIIRLGAITVLMIVFLLGAQMYFTNEEITLAREGCLAIGGIPDVQKSFLHTSYSFNCKVN